MKEFLYQSSISNLLKPAAWNYLNFSNHFSNARDISIQKDNLPHSGFWLSIHFLVFDQRFNRWLIKQYRYNPGVVQWNVFLCSHQKFIVQKLRIKIATQKSGGILTHGSTWQKYLILRIVNSNAYVSRNLMGGINKNTRWVTKLHSAVVLPFGVAYILPQHTICVNVELTLYSSTLFGRDYYR